ncbi:hypothetical protein HJO_07522 [Hyphomonas johnsonii MHS-2]|uniref:Uncharacterized protein n=2 Tax=Hyphomonas johnsonii TaxID=81031 RepID=A0A059FQI7_9PROT|nr:hypothetical protein HJO_07522 [Hyphomonas johnsonii MHS-2]
MMGQGNKAEMLIAVCAVITSVVALFIGWSQMRVMKGQQEAEVWPMVQLTHETDFNDETVSYAITVENAGVGPALIDSFVIAMPGQPTTTDFYELVDYMVGKDIGDPYTAFRSLEGRVVRHGTEMNAIKASWDSTDETRAALQRRLTQFVAGEEESAVVFICYCSILEDCWVSSTLDAQTRPEPVKSCTALDTTSNALLASHAPPKPVKATNP